jgi:hypothetical protein
MNSRRLMAFPNAKDTPYHMVVLCITAIEPPHFSSHPMKRHRRPAPHVLRGWLFHTVTTRLSQRKDPNVRTSDIGRQTVRA